MLDKGIVVKAEGEYCSVEIEKKSECEKCGACLFPNGAGKIRINALNVVGAKEGDEVEIENGKTASFTAVTLAFLVPLLIVIAAVVLNYLLKTSEIQIAIISVISIVLWYTVLAVIDKRLKKKKGFVPEVVKILQKTEKE